MERILVTGGAGSMGKEISLLLAEKGYRVRVFDIPKANFEGLEEKGIEVFKGDITDVASVTKSLIEVDTVVHLAAILPPLSEMKPDLAKAVNVEGTRNLVSAIAVSGNPIRLIFTSTVATYGDTTEKKPYVTADTPQNGRSNYAKTKISAEGIVRDAGINYTILRISGVVLAALLDPPEWPFVEGQRIELVCRDDVVAAILGAVEARESTGKTLIVAGGKSWQMISNSFVRDFFKVLDIPFEDAEYAEVSHYSDWYDTKEAQALLHYQNTSFSAFIKKFQAAVDEVLG
jgi:nucleoside-diphosphate-sugar epimerase